MRRFGFATAAAACIALAACSNDTTGPSALAPTAPHRDASAAAGRFVVMFKNGIPASFAASVQSMGGKIDFSHDGAGIAIVSGVGDAGATQLGALSGVAEVQADADVTLDAPQPVAEAELGSADAIASPTNPTLASRYSWQWNMRLIHANAAWAAGKLGSPNVTVAILDTGIDYDITDLNGLVDLSRSVSFVASDNAITSTYFPSRNPISDYNGHGTNVAEQVSSNGIALAGVTSRTRLIGVKVLGANGSGSLGNILAGITWAADHGANIANMSLGGAFSKAGNGRFVGLINRTFNYANRKGMLIVVAAGNETEDLDHNGNELKTYCGQPHVVCVSAVGPAVATGDQNTPAYYTNFGRSSITVAAPGGNADAANGFTASAWPWGVDVASWVWSYCSKTRIAGFTSTGVPVLTACTAGNRLSGFIGTSQATPHVSGLAALLMADLGTGNVNVIKNRITNSAVDLGETGTDPYFGRGRIDVAAALGL